MNAFLLPFNLTAFVLGESFIFLSRILTQKTRRVLWIMTQNTNSLEEVGLILKGKTISLDIYTPDIYKESLNEVKVELENFCTICQLDAKTKFNVLDYDLIIVHPDFFEAYSQTLLLANAVLLLRK